MNETYTVRKDAIAPCYDFDGNETAFCDVEIDIDLQDIPDDQLRDHVLQSTFLIDDILSELSIEQICGAIKYHNDFTGRWQYIDKVKLLSAIED